MIALANRPDTSSFERRNGAGSLPKVDRFFGAEGVRALPHQGADPVKKFRRLMFHKEISWLKKKLKSAKIDLARIAHLHSLNKGVPEFKSSQEFNRREA